MTIKLMFEMCFPIMLHELVIVLYLRNAEASILWGRCGATSGGLYVRVRSTGSVTRASLRDGDTLSSRHVSSCDVTRAFGL